MDATQIIIILAGMLGTMGPAYAVIQETLALLIAAIPSLLLGAGWTIKRLAGYKDSQIQAALKGAQEERAQSEGLVQEIKRLEKDLTDCRLREMFANYKMTVIEGELRQAKGRLMEENQ